MGWLYTSMVSLQLWQGYRDLSSAMLHRRPALTECIATEQLCMHDV